MRTNIDLDDSLLGEVIERSGATTKKAAVEVAMDFYVRMMRQGDIRKLRGKVQFHEDYDHRAMRVNRIPDEGTAV